MYSPTETDASTNRCSAEVAQLQRVLDEADAVVVGAGAGLSTAAGYDYDGARFNRWFFDFAASYGIRDMYSGGFWPFDTLERFWGWWSRCIYYNRYVPAPRPVYSRLLEVLRGKDYFVLTTNADHCFQRAGFDKQRLFYTQGDYGLWQCSEPCHAATYDNEQAVLRMMEAQGFVPDADGVLQPPADRSALRMDVPAELVPRCPRCGKPLAMNLRCDDTFVEDEGWHEAAARYEDFIRSRGQRRIVYWELGVGGNTPGIIKYPFWQMTCANPRATYVCTNRGEAFCPREIESQSLCFDTDAARIIAALEPCASICTPA